MYAWGGVSYTGILLGSIVGNYGVGRLLERPEKRVWLTVGIAANLAILAYFKYATFAVRQANDVLQGLGAPGWEVPRTALPLGISFYTFQAVSYLIDTYRGTTPAQRNPLRLGLYVSFFPQLIAGPIVRYRDLDRQLAVRSVSWEKTATGLERFLSGLSKKVLIANTLATVTEEIFALDFTTMSAPTALAGVLLYAAQLYYDFSGYSDMAIGLGLLFGFRLPENFNFPYASVSIRDFWRRWHITLGAWFRDYLYLPLGGSRGGRWQTIRNLLLVFVATGLWHGAAWSFVLWGLWHGLFIVLERQRWWPFGGVLYALPVVLLGWVLFRTESLGLSLRYYAALFGRNDATVAFDWPFYWSAEQTIAAAIAAAGCWPWWQRISNALPPMTSPRSRGEGPAERRPGRIIFPLAKIIGLLALFLLCTNALVNNNLNPFIYFRF